MGKAEIFITGILKSWTCRDLNLAATGAGNQFGCEQDVRQAREFGAALWSREPNQCCNIRKVEPLTKKLSELDAWVTGIRRDQAPTRANARKLDWDAKFGLVKINPLADWKWEQVWDYIREHRVPYNRLHDQGYPSIGCGPCTRAVEPGRGQDIRAGRWWWESPEQKECGLHVVDGKLVRKKR